jgi:membrane protease YdiL (CAAX protease family)
MPTTQPSPSETEIILSRVEEVLTVLGVLIVLAGLWPWWMRRRIHRDPLVGSPIRRSKLAPVHVFGIIFGSMIGIGLSSAIGERLVPVEWPEEARTNVVSLVGASGMNLSLAVLCLVAAAHAFPGGVREFGLGRTPWVRDVTAAILLWAVALSLTWLTLWVTIQMTSFVWPEFVAPEHGVFQALRDPGLDSWVSWLAHASALLIAPLGEELFFRGIVQSGVMKLAAPRWGSLYHRHVAVGAAAVLFGLMHWGTPHHIPALIVLGLILGYAYERTGSLRVPIMIHILFNAKSLLWYALTAAR